MNNQPIYVSSCGVKIQTYIAVVLNSYVLIKFNKNYNLMTEVFLKDEFIFIFVLVGEEIQLILYVWESLLLTMWWFICINNLHVNTTTLFFYVLSINFIWLQLHVRHVYTYFTNLLVLGPRRFLSLIWTNSQSPLTLRVYMSCQHSLYIFSLDKKRFDCWVSLFWRAIAKKRLQSANIFRSKEHKNLWYTFFIFKYLDRTKL